MNTCWNCHTRPAKHTLCPECKTSIQAAMNEEAAQRKAAKDAARASAPSWQDYVRAGR